MAKIWVNPRAGLVLRLFLADTERCRASTQPLSL
uniref:Uncharacterized protein n=1 Tax=Anguilla anguilla TaxID=7936 RepID=A0A0E9TX92_ANGAN